MKNSERFFANTDCKYYPCHKGIKEMNCLFCYCPFFLSDKCPGKPNYIERDDYTIKDCSGCLYPHRPANYDRMMDQIGKVIRKRK